MAVAEFVLPHDKPRNRSSAMRWMIGHAADHWWIVIVVLFGAFGNAVGASLVPLFIGQAFDVVVAGEEVAQGLARIAFLIVISQVVRAILQFSRNFGVDVLGQRIVRDIRDELYASLLGKSMTFHNLQPVGDTMARATNDVREIGIMFSPGLNLIIGSANFILLPLIVAPQIYPSLIAIPLLFAVSYVIAVVQYLSELRSVTEDVRITFGTLNTHLTQAIDGIEVVKGHAQEETEVERFAFNAATNREAFVKQGDVESRFLPLLLLGLAEAGAFLQGAILLRQGTLDLGDVVAFIGLIQLFGFPTFISMFAYSQVSLGMASARRILDLINQRTELDRNPSGYSGRLRGQIEFRSVSYAFGADERVLDDISFQVSPGHTLAIVGQTGSGKTTLAKLINRVNDVNSGQLLVDGVDVRDWNLAELRSQISIIEQDVFLFSRSIAENIAFGRRGASQDEIEQAAREAQAHEFITTFSDGYETIVGERGVTLSGGQRQRIALARAFLTDPRILILDDSTSSIDSATEDEIQRAIFQASEGRTTVIITHRLSQIRWADVILVLRKGRLIASGAHEKLLATTPSYKQIFAGAEA